MMENWSLFSLMLVSIAVKGYVGSWMLFHMLDKFNRKNGVEFTDILKKMQRNPQALADYFRTRFIGVSLIISAAIIGSLL